MESRGPEDSKNVKTSQAYFFEGFISFFEDFSLTIWLLKSPIIMNGFGSYANRCSKSAILKRSPGGKYKEHT